MRRSLQLDRSLRPPKHHHGRKNAHAQATLQLLEASIEKCIQSITNLKASTDRELLALHTQANMFSNDMQRIVYALQNIVIMSFKDGVSDPDLASAVKKFSLFAYSVQQCFSDDSKVLKNQLKENLGKIMPEARGLVGSVEGNVNHEYIHEVVNSLDDILFAVQKIEFRNEFQNYIADDLISHVIKFNDQFATAFNSFDEKNLSIVRDLKHATREPLKKVLRMVNLLDEAADNYNEEIRNILLQGSYGLMHDIGVIDVNVRQQSNVTSIKCYVLIGVGTVSLEIENIVEVLKINIDDQQVANNLHNLVLTLCSYIVALQNQVVRNIELASKQTNDD